MDIYKEVVLHVREHPWDVRIWIPEEQCASEDHECMDVKEFLKRTQETDRKELTKQLLILAQANAVEVKHINTGHGSVYYKDWP